MKVAIVSRHKSTVELVRERFRDVEVFEHVSDIDALKGFDLVIGNLPLHMVAELKEAGVRYVMVSLELPRELRGRELNIEELRKFVKFVEVESLKIKEFKL